MAAWTPADLPALVDRFRADDAGSITATGNTLSRWTDQEAGGVAPYLDGQMTTGVETVNGFNSLGITDNTSDGLAHYGEYSPGNSDMTLYIAVTSETKASDDSAWWSMNQDGNSRINLSHRKTGVWRFSVGSVFVEAPAVAGHQVVTCYRRGGEIGISVNGSAPVAAQGALAVGYTSREFIGRGNGLSEWWNKPRGHITDYGRTLAEDPADFDRIAGYHCHKYAIALPAGHPYEAAAPTTGGAPATFAGSGAGAMAPQTGAGAGSRLAVLAPRGLRMVPRLGRAAIAASASLAPAGLRMVPRLGRAAIAASASLAPAGLRVMPRLGRAAITASAGLAPAGLRVMPRLGRAAIAASANLAPRGLRVVPRLGRAAITTANGLAPRGLRVVPRLGRAAIAASANLAPAGLRVVPRLGRAAIIASAVLAPAGLRVVPRLGRAAISAANGLAPAGLRVVPRLGRAAITASAKLAARGLRVVPRLGRAAIAGRLAVPPGAARILAAPALTPRRLDIAAEPRSLNAKESPMNWPDKDPSDRLDYAIDWTAALDPGDAIAAVAWSVPDGLTADSTARDGAVAVVWLSGGLPRRSYAVSCKITTAAGREIERTARLRVRER